MQRAATKTMKPAGPSVAQETAISASEAEIQTALSLCDDESFRFLFEYSPQPTWVYDNETLRFLEVNEAAVRRYGYTRAEFLGMTIADIRPTEDVESLRKDVSKNTLEYRKRRGWRHRLKSGELITVDVYVRMFRLKGRRVSIVVVVDVTNVKKLQESLRLQTAYFKQLFSLSQDAIAIIDGHGVIYEANAAFERLFLYSHAELLGSDIQALIVPESHYHETYTLWARLYREGTLHHETVRKRKDGSTLYVSIAGNAIKMGNRDVGYYVVFRDVTQERRAAYEMERQSTHDLLTDVLTRREFERTFQHLLRSNGKSRFQGILLFVDIDQFKVVNDAGGYGIGDSVLQRTAEIIADVVGHIDLVARLVGDEFAVLLINRTPEEALELSGRLLAAIRKHRFDFEECHFSLTASIGMADIGDAGDDFKDLMSAVEGACRVAKTKGGDRAYVYRADDQEGNRRKNDSTWLVHIRDALENDRFVLYHQAIHRTGDRQDVAHSEILLRIRNDDGSIVFPNLFIPAAERYRLMPRLDRHVLSKVFASYWERAREDAPTIIGINLSGETIVNPEFVDYVKDAFKASGVPPSSICFEITETTAIADMDNAAAFINEMRQLGCAIALDDFGSGMSSFEYLKLLKIDYLKIDKLFIKDLAGNPVGCEMVRAITSMARAMGVKTVAEYVETEQVLHELRGLDVDFVQGYAIHSPEPW